MKTKSILINEFSLIFILLKVNILFSQATDIDNNKYGTIEIGKTIWMSKNLNVSKFSNGDKIFEAKSIEDWEKAMNDSIPAYCYYDFNKKFGKKYGKLYNGFAVRDKRGLAPEGWHISDSVDWVEILNNNSLDKVSKLLIIQLGGTHDPFGGSWGMRETSIFWLGNTKDTKEEYDLSLIFPSDIKEAFDRRHIFHPQSIRCVKNKK